MKKYILGVLMAVICSLGLTSCFKDLDTMPLDENQLVADQVYATTDGYMGVLAKCYASLILTGQNGGDGGNGDLIGANEGYSGYVRLLFYLQELTTDNHFMPSGSNGLRICNTHQYDPANAPVVTWTYQRLYMSIAYSNEFLRECTKAKLQSRGVWDEMKDKYLEYRAEARLIRAYAYVMLCDLFGNVPIVDETVGPKDLPVQYSRAEVFAYAEKELKAISGETGDCEDLLAQPKAALYGHVDRVSAWMLLSRMYLNAKTWIDVDRYQDCYTYSKRVIESNTYPLASDYRHIFLADNNTCPEIIWPLVQDGERAQSSAGTNFYVKAFVNGAMESYYRTGVGTRGWGNVRAKTNLVDVFDPNDVPFDVNDTWGNNKNDKRAQFMTVLEGGAQVKETWDENGNWTSTFTRGYGYIKWRNVTKDDQPAPSGEAYTSIDFPLLRTAEAYLNGAEAILRGASGSEALKWVNEIRMRAYMSDDYAKAGIKSDVSGKIASDQLTLDFILDERQKEFASECYRRTDLIRFGKYVSGYNWDWKNGEREGADIAPHRVLFPIPEDELTNNPTLKQNPGYPVGGK